MPDATTAVHRVLTEKFEVAPADITPDATLESLDLDSLSLAELALSLQEQLDVKVEEYEATKATTVAGLIAALQAKLALAGAQ
ncbi:phosphopantetheine-binding protein [Streptomyces sp. NPDC050738]|uniref:phosphopantetheine-binding protein n=1 Tax=Streptomyces sp. NPDC050738 TaxID=3154744 RepID=UPI0034338A2E